MMLLTSLTSSDSPVHTIKWHNRLTEIRQTRCYVIKYLEPSFLIA
jgi:hypothetical protein